MNWGYFLPWMTYWACTTMACLLAGLYCGYSWGRDAEAADREETGP